MAQLLKIKAQVSRIWAKGCILMIMCVFYLTGRDNPSLVKGEGHGILYIHSKRLEEYESNTISHFLKLIKKRKLTKK